MFFFIIYIYYSLSVLYLFLLAVAGRFFFPSPLFLSSQSLPSSAPSWPSSSPLSSSSPSSQALSSPSQPSASPFPDPPFPPKRIAILVPAYKEDKVILSTVTNLLQLDYPREAYDIYVIADSFGDGALEELRSLPLYVHEVSFANSTKTKSLNESFCRIDRSYDIALICDGDNMLGNDFLRKIDRAFSGGAKAIQGKRVAKNLDTPFAVLDACSEAINNNIFRKGANALRLSSPICGSGMAFEYSTLKKTLAGIDAVGGFDKVLQLKMVQQQVFVHYLEDALIYDEKVDSSYAFGQQRKRWISSQLIYSRQYFLPAFAELFKGNISYFNLALANYSIPPKAFLFAILPLLIPAGFWISGALGMAAIALWLLYLLTIGIALPRTLVGRDLFHAILSLPRAVFLMFGALFQFKRADETFIHTPHSKTAITKAKYPQ